MFASLRHEKLAFNSLQAGPISNGGKAKQERAETNYSAYGEARARRGRRQGRYSGHMLDDYLRGLLVVACQLGWVKRYTVTSLCHWQFVPCITYLCLYTDPFQVQWMKCTEVQEQHFLICQTVVVWGSQWLYLETRSTPYPCLDSISWSWELDEAQQLEGSGRSYSPSIPRCGQHPHNTHTTPTQLSRECHELVTLNRILMADLCQILNQSCGSIDNYMWHMCWQYQTKLECMILSSASTRPWNKLKLCHHAAVPSILWNVLEKLCIPPINDT